MTDWFSAARWSPYAVGIGIGVLCWFSFLLSDKPIGVSTAFVRTSGMIERLFRGDKALEKPYYRKIVPQVDWGWMLLVGIVVGAYLSARLSGTFQLVWVPDKWAVAFGDDVAVRWVVALVGGVLMGLGARWAGGCTSGHGISGTLQLGVASWVAAFCIFIGGIATALVIFRFGG